MLRIQGKVIMYHPLIIPHFTRESLRNTFYISFVENDPARNNTPTPQTLEHYS